MFFKIIALSISSYLIGILVFYLLNRKSPQPKFGGRIVPELINVLLISIIYLSIVFIPLLLYIITAFLILIAFREILNASDSAGKKPYLPLIIGGAILFLFALFIKNTNPEFVLFTYFIMVHFDGFNNLISKNYQGHKVLPRLNNNFSWEGLVVSIIVILSISFVVFGMENSQKTLAQVGILAICAFLGNALSSYYKRACGINQYSHLIPQQGGILDRFSGFFLSGAIFELLQMFYTH